MLCGLTAGLAQGATYLGIASGDWGVGANWNQGSIPDDDITSKININTGVTITVTGAQFANSIAIGDSGGTQGTLVVDGGTLFLDSTGTGSTTWSGIGYNAGAQMSVINGGTATFIGRLDLGVAALNSSLTERHNSLTVDNGSTVLLSNLRMGPGFGVAETASSALITIGDGSSVTVNGALQWGTITAGTKNIDISGTGRLILNGDQTTNVETWISGGYISGNGVSGIYDSNLGQTIVSVPEPSTLVLFGALGGIGLLLRRRS